MRRKFNTEEIQKAVSIFRSRNALAEKMNVSYQSISDWINGRKTPSLENCLKIEEVTEGKVKVKNILSDFPWEDSKK
jgi:DNA-binding transcriptional regulator YdaS (Cro superfamily)